MSQKYMDKLFLLETPINLFVLSCIGQVKLMLPIIQMKLF